MCHLTDVAFIVKHLPKGDSTHSEADMRTLERVVICQPPTCHSYQDFIALIPWEEIDHVLVRCRHLSSFDVLCSASISVAEVEILSAELVDRMPSARVCLRHLQWEGDATTLEPELFQSSESPIHDLYLRWPSYITTSVPYI